jgi:hypothetical protein
MNRQEQPHRGDLERLMTPRLKKLTMMIALARIGFCLTYWVWRESMPMVSNCKFKNQPVSSLASSLRPLIMTSIK